MKKKIWNKTNVPSIKASGCWMRINPKSGALIFSGDLVELLNLQKHGVEFIQDEERPADWYVQPSKDSEAFTPRFKKANKHDRTCIVQSTSLARTILKSTGGGHHQHEVYGGHRGSRERSVCHTHQERGSYQETQSRLTYGA
jgi:hypothetical protein